MKLPCLRGAHVRLAPLDPDADAADLFAASHCCNVDEYGTGNRDLEAETAQY